MTELQALQDRFLDYLRNANPGIEKDISGNTDEERARRLSIYYNAYRVRLRGSIETDHPVLGIYLGDDEFDKMAAGYIDAHPSSETSLRFFCDRLPEFLRTQARYAPLGILAEIASFERLLMDVFDAADADPIGLDSLSALPADAWPQLTLQTHPSIRTYVTTWNSVGIWQAIKAERTPPDAQQADTHVWLLWRNRHRLTEFQALSADEFAALTVAMKGETFALVCERLLEWHTEEEVAARASVLLQKWMEAGLITGCSAIGVGGSLVVV